MRTEEEICQDGRVPLTRENYLQRQVEEALSPTNIYFAGKQLGRNPTKEEAVLHYIQHGGSENFSSRYCCIDESCSVED